MRFATAALCLVPLIVPTTQSFASECGMQIKAIERRMHSEGASEVTGEPASPASKSQASNAQGHAPAPTNPEQKATPEKMKAAQALIDKAKEMDRNNDKDGCERTMTEAQKTMGAVP
jgi:hypothetical protein